MRVLADLARPRRPAHLVGRTGRRGDLVLTGDKDLLDAGLTWPRPVNPRGYVYLSRDAG